MAINLRDIEEVVCNQCFFQQYLWRCRGEEGITYSVIHSSVHGKHNGVNFESVHHSIRKLHLF